MQSLSPVLLAILCGGLGVAAGPCGNPPLNQLFRDGMNADTECGTQCGKMCFQNVIEANLYFAGDFDAVVGQSAATFLEECSNEFNEKGFDVSCEKVHESQESIKVVLSGPADDVNGARHHAAGCTETEDQGSWMGCDTYAVEVAGIKLQSFARLFVEPFDPIFCTRHVGNEKTCWADTAWGECHSRGGGQNAYDLVMAETDVRIQYMLREGCGKLMPEECLSEEASSSFQGRTCKEILRTAICGVDAGDKFRACAGQGQCSCAEGAVWGLGADCSGAACMAGCAPDGGSFTGGMLTTSQLSDLVAEARDGESKLTQAIDMLAAHIDGTGSTLLDSEILVFSGRFEDFAAYMKQTPALVGKAFDLVDTYEASAHGPLFVKGGEFPRSDPDETDPHAIDRAMLQVQQAIIDEVYRAGILAECSREVFAGRGWQTSTYYPGAAPPPADDTVVHSVVVKATVPASWGMPVGFYHDHAQKPTGLYLSPGAIGTVTVPESLVGKGYRVLVGAQVSDNKWKSTVKRMDRVTVTYEITSTTTLIANPLGGGVYLMVPYLADEGLVELQISGGVIEAPLFRRTSFDQMTNADWQERRTAPAPWADFETDSFMLNVPRSWIYAYEDPTTLMQNYDKSMQGTAEWLGYPPAYRNRKVLFLGVDLHIKASAYGVGYPQVNNLYQAGRDYGGNHNHWMLQNPQPGWAVCYHELGHAQTMSMYPGETEAINNFMYTFIAHTQFGVPFDKAFNDGQSHSNYTPDDAAIHWMTTPTFHAGNEMDRSSSEHNQMRYQHRGYAKYADVVRLFGWEAFTKFYNQENLDYNAGSFVSGGPDGRTLRFSVAAGFDLMPLMRFWGVNAQNEASLAAAIKVAGLGPSEQVRCLLNRYKTIIPASNAAFNDHYEKIYPGKPYKASDNPLYGIGWYHAQSGSYDSAQFLAGVARIDALLQQYFPSTARDACDGVQAGEAEVAVPESWSWMPADGTTPWSDDTVTMVGGGGGGGGVCGKESCALRKRGRRKISQV